MIRLTKNPISRHLSGMFIAVSVAASTTVLSARAHAQTPVSEPMSIQDDKNAPINVQAVKMTGRMDREVTLEKDVELVQGQTKVAADKAVFRIIQNEVEVEGNVWMQRLQDRYTGDHAVLNMDSGEGYVQQPTYHFGTTGGRGKAERIDFLSKDQAVVTQGTYSTCEALDPDWYLSADTLELDAGRDVGTMRGGTVYFKGVPVFAAPSMSFPLSGERKSGVLPPTIGMSTNNGLELTVPYYFNIAPNRDLTLYPKYIARRGLQLGVNGRYLGETYAGEVSAEGIQDRMTGTGRYSLSTKHQQTLAPNLSLAWNVNKASDDEYVSDFSRTITQSSQRLLVRDVSLQYDSRYWSAVGRVSKYQLMQDIDNPIQKPYDRVPQLTVQAQRHDFGGFDLSLTSEYTRFSNTSTLGGTSQELVGGDRMYITPSIAYPIVRPGYSITPKITLDATTYRLTNVNPGAEKSFNRVLPTYSLDAGMHFEREMNLFGHNLTQTLEPRLFYVRTPYRDQSMLPNFDSGVTDFNFAQIFNENRFVGHDRIGDANQLTAAVISRFFEEDGQERLRVAFGQRFYFSTPRVTIDNSDTTIQGSRSDLLLSASGPVSNTVKIDTMMQYSQTLAQMVRSTYGVSWQPAPKKVLNLQYRLDRTTENLKQLDVSAQWPLFQRWYAVGRANYSIPDKKIAEGLLGVEYQADCWVFRLVAQRIPTTSTKASTSFFIQLELNGFSKVGSNPLEALKSSIPGYQRIN
jgi:LPS-assembly protein